jgi:probable rRNA maturation factor
MARAEHQRGIRAEVVDGRGRRLRLRALSSWLEQAAPRRARGGMSVALVGDARIRALNRQYRHRDEVTDVLYDDGRRKSSSSSNSSLVRLPAALRSTYLGDVVIARSAARRQAKDAGHSELTELRILALHGLLHLLGYDHERDHGEMARLEERLRRRAGLGAEGLVARAGRDDRRRPSVLDTREGSARGSSEQRSASERSGGGAPRPGSVVSNASGVGMGPHANKR